MARLVIREGDRVRLATNLTFRGATEGLCRPYAGIGAMGEVTEIDTSSPGIAWVLWGDGVYASNGTDLDEDSMAIGVDFRCLEVVESAIPDMNDTHAVERWLDKED
jgi:hypothetical protein